MKYLSGEEIVDLGLLQELNRLLLHPRGLALELTVFEDEGVVDEHAVEMRVQDHREDPEGVVFGDGDPEDSWRKAAAFEGLLGLTPKREGRFGWVVQPVGDVVEAAAGDEVEE